MDELEAMATFVRVAEAGSFTRAAKQLGTTQGTVSRRIADLEASLGTLLLRRTTRHVGVTEPGQAYLVACRRALDAVAAARDVAAADAGLTGTLRVAVPLSWATAWLAPRLPAFLTAHPGLSVQLLGSNARVDLVAEGFDVAVRIGRAEALDAHARQLGHTHRWAVASPSYLAHRGSPTVDTLERHDVLAYSLADATADWTIEVGDERKRLRPRRVVEADSGEVLRQIVLAGFGFAVLPHWLVEPDMAAKRLVRVMEGVRFPPSPIRALWYGTRRPPSRVRAFVDWLKQLSVV